MGLTIRATSRGTKQLRYYADSGFINKGKAVCEWHAIPKEHLEGFVLRIIREKLLDSVVPRKLEELIEKYLDSRRNIYTPGGLSTIEDQLRQNEARLENLLMVVEKGIDLETVLPRIRQIEAENMRLRRKVILTPFIGQ